MDEVRSSRLWPSVIFVLGAAYFIVPLLATFIFSLRMRRNEYSFDAYERRCFQIHVSLRARIFRGHRAS